MAKFDYSIRDIADQNQWLRATAAQSQGTRYTTHSRDPNPQSLPSPMALSEMMDGTYLFRPKEATMTAMNNVLSEDLAKILQLQTGDGGGFARGALTPADIQRMGSVVVPSGSSFQQSAETGEAIATSGTVSDAVGSAVINSLGNKVPPNLDRGAVTSEGYYLMPPAPGGEYSFSFGESARYGCPELLTVLWTFAKQMHSKYGDRTTIMFGDLTNSNPSKHKSHRTGIDADINSFGVGANGFVFEDYTKSTPFNREASIEAAVILYKTGLVYQVYFNDAETIREVNAATRPNFMKSVAGHANHFHVRVKPEFALTNVTNNRKYWRG